MNKQDLQLLAAIGQRVATQDNRITDQPIFIVQRRVRDWGYDDEYAEGYEWTNVDNDYESATETRARRLDALHNDFRETYPWVRIGYRDRWEFVTACFTESGCEEYLRVNGHNLRGPARIYAEGSFRNAEYQGVRKALLRLAEDGGEA